MLKIQSDSIDMIAAEAQHKIAQTQLERAEKLYKDRLKSLTYFEAKKPKSKRDTSQKNWY